MDWKDENLFWEDATPPIKVETRSYTTMCKVWRKMREDEPPTYADWVAQVVRGRVLVVSA